MADQARDVGAMDPLDGLTNLDPKKRKSYLEPFKDKAEVLQDQLRQAELLRKPNEYQHTTGIGAALGGLGDIVNAGVSGYHTRKAREAQEALMGRKQGSADDVLGAILAPYLRKGATQAMPTQGEGEVEHAPDSMMPLDAGVSDGKPPIDTSIPVKEPSGQVAPIASAPQASPPPREMVSVQPDYSGVSNMLQQPDYSGVSNMLQQPAPELHQPDHLAATLHAMRHRKPVAQRPKLLPDMLADFNSEN